MCNLLNGLVIAGGVDLGDDADDETDSKTGDDRPCGIVAAEHGLAQNYGSHNDEQSGNVGTHLECLVRVGAVLAADEEGCDNGSENAAGGNDEREEDVHGFIVKKLKSAGSDAEGHCGDDSTDIALKEVGAHACNVAYIVADVIGDNSGVAGVVFGDACLDLADEVGADVSSLGVDTAADTGKERNGGSTEREAEEDFGVLGDDVENACAEKTETDDAHTHDGAAGEGDGESLVHSVLSGVCGTDVSLGGNVHADVACENGKHRTADEAAGGDPVAETETDSNEKDYNKDDKDLVLGEQEGTGAITDTAGNFLHAVVACVLLAYIDDLVDSEKQSEDRHNWGQIDNLIHQKFTPISSDCNFAFIS